MSENTTRSVMMIPEEGIATTVAESEEESVPLIAEMHKQMVASQQIMVKLSLRKLSTKRHQEIGEKCNAG